MVKPKMGRRAIRAAVTSVGGRLYKAREPLAVFVVQGEAVVIRASSQRCEAELRRADKLCHLVGVYDARADMSVVEGDLMMFAAR